jgi:hypothetical protein
VDEGYQLCHPFHGEEKAKNIIASFEHYCPGQTQTKGKNNVEEEYERKIVSSLAYGGRTTPSFVFIVVSVMVL